MSHQPTPLEHYRTLESGLAALIPPYKFSAAINLKLERITRLLELLGNPHHRFPSIHIGGTSGKGSTATIMAALLHAAGYRTGLHVSPHLQILNERHQIDGIVAPTSALLALFESMQPALAQVADELPFGPPSYFEAQFALACLWFAAQQVDVAVIEVGLGGTLDATNVIPAQVAVLTNVGLDHTQILGDTIEKIITDKAGIIKPGQTVLSGVRQPSAQAIVRDRCARVGATCRFITEPTVDAVPGLTGYFQRLNASLALAAAAAFTGTPLPEPLVAQALAQVRFPGRMEVVQHDPVVVLDGAHNPDKMAAAAQAMDAAYPTQRRVVVLALKADKDAAQVVRLATARADRLIVTQFYAKGLWEALPADVLAATAAAAAADAGRDLPVVVEPDPLRAVAQALAAAAPDDVVWVTGSLYLVGDARAHWFPVERLVDSAESRLSAALTLP